MDNSTSVVFGGGDGGGDMLIENVTTVSPTTTTTTTELMSSSSLLTEAQDITLSLLPMFSGALSAWGSFNIIYMLITSNKEWTPYRRILFGLSCSDLISSTVLSFQPFLVPAATSTRIYAVGTNETCTAMGFFTQLSFCNVWYSGMLSFYFLLTVRFGIRQHQLAKWYEPWMHALAIGYNLITASVGAAMGFYTELDLGHGCYVADWPEGCGCKDNDGNTIEGAECCKSPLVVWIYAGLPFMFFYLTISVNNLLVYLHVKRTIQKSRSYVKDYNPAINTRSMESTTRQNSRRSSTFQSIVADSFRRMRNSMTTYNSNDYDDEGNVIPRESTTTTSREDAQAKRIQAVAVQGFLYVAAIIIPMTPVCVLRVLEWMGYDDQERTLFPLLVVNATLWPLQGLWNCLIFVRPSYEQARKEFPNESRFWAFRRALHGAKVQPTDDMD